MALHVGAGLKDIVRRQLTERAAATGERAARPVTTVKSEALFDLQFRATVEGHSFISDEREEGGGHDAGPAPLRYFLAGIMMCHQVWCVKSAAVADVKLDRLECEISGYVEPTIADSPAPSGFARAAYTVTVESPNSAEEVEKVVDQACRRCAAFVTFQRSARIDVTLIHNGNTIGERAYGPG